MLDSLKKYKVWGDIPAIKSCCDGECKGVSVDGINFCNAVNSPDFKECCIPPLSCCNRNSTTFCLLCSSVRATRVEDVNCFLYDEGIAYPSRNKCRTLSSNMNGILSKMYQLNGRRRKLLCDMIEKYQNFCNDAVTTLNSVVDDSKNNVVELKCGCNNCKYLGRNPGAVCNEEVTINYSNRTTIEGNLGKVGLLNEAKSAIKSGFAALGTCPFTR